MKLLTIENKSRAVTIGTGIELANTFLTRLVGLLGRKGLDTGGGLLIDPSSGVHTFGMRFAIDVVALDRQHRVHAVWPRLTPWKTSGVSWKIHSVLELPAGTIERCGIEAGDQLAILQDRVSV